LVAVTVSLLPAFWILTFLLIPFLNLYTWEIHAVLGLSKSQYVLLQIGYLLRAIGIALGTVLSIRFAIRCIRSHRLRVSPTFVVLLVIAVACGVHLEVSSSKAPPETFHLGFFEIPIVSWFVVGIVASLGRSLPRTPSEFGRQA
jgi:hypothetical protein